MMKIVRVTNKGQVSIPNTFRKKIGINQGDELLFIEVQGKILIEKSDKIIKESPDYLKEIMKYSEHSLKEVWDNEEDDIWNQYIK